MRPGGPAVTRLDLTWPSRAHVTLLESMTSSTGPSAGPKPAVSSPRLAGRSALVTGSTSGIGAAIALALALEGAHVVVSGRDGTRAKEVVEQIHGLGGRADFVEADLAGTYADLRAFASTVTSLLGGRVDILVNNAGVYPVTATEDLQDGDLDRMLAVNVRAPHVLVASLVPAMVRQGSGAVIMIGSWMASTGSPGGAMYTATKAAAEQLTRAWAAEFGPAGVRVNTVAPGVTLTPGNQAYRAVLDAMTAATPAGVVVQPQDVARGVVFLASDDASMIHGTTLYVDGGISATRMS
jgi:NAD(P)-dependent dehydrogenase (short-subunit alcohol dehydrogenase family)